MSGMAYIMETQDPHELWLVDGENKFKVSRDMYWLLASEGADLPPKHHITELLNENAKLRELAAGIGHLLFSLDVDYCVACPRDSINHPCPAYTVNDGECLYKTDLRDLGIEVDK